MNHGIFGAAINCLDGRTQAPVAEWIKNNFHVDYVDMITEPGVDKGLTAWPEKTDWLKQKTRISTEKHGSKVVAVVGHYDCAGNPVSKEEHWEHVKAGVEIVKGWALPDVAVVGLWVNENWQVEEVV